ncbi:iron hydrogenase [Cylindrobasidium torrendii FP15055 ss-10]|uniref:Iron hydrogenase n=1 Tax=Cylindrobasidium torrendii FP15055 ss-10 TaxID=1314674 RepID=A0A0D7BS78_9AGAR|nr:iron hydrogenase [Cylindrobasidium torrendii FP15055 ss-10]
MAFSGALTLTDLNDYLGPSQACIKPVEQSNPSSKEEKGAASTAIQVDLNGAYYEVSNDGLAASKSTHGPRKLEQAQINLNDCLACSGCITSAESVLITLQSHVEVLNVLDRIATTSDLCDDRQVPVISIAPQSLASLATALSTRTKRPVSLLQVMRRVQAFFKEKLGVTRVYDTTFSREVALREHVKEFFERKEASTASDSRLPMLASACPGWICYAEKAHAEMLPFISNTKSPQQTMGTLVKSWMGSQWGKLPNQIYHVSIMPCYDKKLEASRSDFYNELYSSRDVDCVITTGELDQMMVERCWDISQPIPDELVPLRDESVPQLPELIQHTGSSSGSYMHSIMASLAATCASPIRNADYEEWVLRKDTPEGDVLFKGAKCYGFRNLQNVVRKVGKGKGLRGVGAAGRLPGRAVARRKAGQTEERNYDYVEVMACPGGCVNGGGQLKSALVEKENDQEGFTRDWNESGVDLQQEVRWGNKEWTRRVEETYWEGTILPVQHEAHVAWKPAVAQGGNREKVDEMVQRISSALTRDGKANPLRTEYHTVESEEIGLAVRW